MIKRKWLAGFILAGMAVTSHNAGLLGSAAFDTVSLTAGP